MILPPAAFCHRCQRETPTVYLALSSGHTGNCCAVCRATRKGHPFVSRHELNPTSTNVAIRSDRRTPHGQTLS